VLFNSFIFLFLFLPATFLGFFLIGRRSRALAALWLFAASLFFYGWWNPVFTILLLCSILFNYSVGAALARAHALGRAVRGKWILGIGVAANLGLIAYFKYAGFFVEGGNALLGLGWRIESVVLPLGISFYTFTQIAFLVDAHRGEVREVNFIHYGLFVTYFPHLIAGPVLHHKEMMPQFALPGTYRVHWENLSVGATIFAIGLFKKVVLADGVAPLATPVFKAASDGATVTFAEAWLGALAYTFQLYFDFSGYSDMAIGLSRLFGVKLPLNFDSPYKAVNIIEFWRRWHMTLSRFLRDYLYFPLGGNRKGPVRRYLNLLITMVLGGLWHGAGLTFVVWGALHGIYLVINHAWRRIRRVLGDDVTRSTPAGRLASMTLTFLAVVVAWVFFRADSLDAAWAVLRGMSGLNGFGAPPATGAGEGVTDTAAFRIAALWALAWLAPNTQQLMAAFKPALGTASPTRWPGWQPDVYWFSAVALGLACALAEMGEVSEFLYFQF
jgi:D-alanyl-lipoteichoic acid acyltransferase DltB (MBOAT superfamily)